MKDQPTAEKFVGLLTLPGDKEPREVSLILNEGHNTLVLKFSDPIEGNTEWNASTIRVTKRQKYLEIWFSTKGLPKATVELSWKCNAGLEDNTIAGVVVARPNDEKVSGEKGFSLIRN